MFSKVYLFAQLENSKTDREDEGQESKFQGIEGFQSQNSDGHWDNGH